MPVFKVYFNWDQKVWTSGYKLVEAATADEAGEKLYEMWGEGEYDNNSILDEFGDECETDLEVTGAEFVEAVEKPVEYAYAKCGSDDLFPPNSTQFALCRACRHFGTRGVFSVEGSNV